MNLVLKIGISGNFYFAIVIHYGKRKFSAYDLFVGFSVTVGNTSILFESSYSKFPSDLLSLV